MKHTHIGDVSQGVDGTDIYDRFDFEGDETTNSITWMRDEALKAAQRMHYREGRGPGSPFCTFFRLMPVQYSCGASYIVISNLRYDI